jgi:hypothetical protein
MCLCPCVLGFLKTYSLDAVGVIHGKLRVVLGLNTFVDDPVDDTQGVEVKFDAFLGAIGNFQVLFVEVVEELRMLDLKN